MHCSAIENTTTYIDTVKSLVYSKKHHSVACSLNFRLIMHYHKGPRGPKQNVHSRPTEKSTSLSIKTKL